MSIILDYLRTLSPVRDLSLKDLTLKTVVIIALDTAARGQTLHQLDLDSMVTGKSSYTFQVGIIKQSRPGYTTPLIKLKAYAVDRRICVVTVLNEYIRRTHLLRGDNSKLFITYLRPYRPVAKDTISR